jgi:hypothetical protein
MNWIEEITSPVVLSSNATSSAITTTAGNITTRRGPIDPDTPTSAYTKTGESGKGAFTFRFTFSYFCL